MTIAPTKIQSSDLNRFPLRAFAAAEDGPVLVTRRDGQNLVLMTELEANARMELFEFAAKLIAVTTDDRGTLVERMANMFPWIFALDENEREACVKDIINSARASFVTGQAHLVMVELSAWRESAENIAAGLHELPEDRLPERILVERPVRIA